MVKLRFQNLDECDCMGLFWDFEYDRMRVGF